MDNFCIAKGVVFLDTCGVGLCYGCKDKYKYFGWLVCICGQLFVRLKEIVEGIGGFQFFFCVI